MLYPFHFSPIRSQFASSPSLYYYLLPHIPNPTKLNTSHNPLSSSSSIYNLFPNPSPFKPITFIILTLSPSLSPSPSTSHRNPHYPVIISITTIPMSSNHHHSYHLHHHPRNPHYHRYHHLHHRPLSSYPKLIFTKGTLIVESFKHHLFQRNPNNIITYPSRSCVHHPRTP